MGSLSAGHWVGSEHWLLPHSESCKTSLEETGGRPEIICLQTAPRGELASAARRTNRQHFSVCSTNISPVLARGQTSATDMSQEWPNPPQWTFKEQFSFMCHLRVDPFSVAGAFGPPGILMSEKRFLGWDFQKWLIPFLLGRVTPPTPPPQEVPVNRSFPECLARP